MKCSKTRVYLKDYLDDHLNSQLKEQVAGHIASCNDCRKELAFLKSYLEQTKTITKMEAPSDFIAKVHQKIRKSEPTSPSRRPRFFPLPVPVTAFAGILIVAVLMFYFNNPFQLAKNKELVKRPVPAGIAKTGAKPEDRSVMQYQTPAADGITTERAKKELNYTLTETRDQKVTGTVVLTLLLKSAVPMESGEKSESETTSPLFSGRTSKSSIDQGLSGTGQLEQNEATGPPDDLNQVINGIKSLVNSLGGRLDNAKNKPENKSAQLLVIKIPAQNYPQFLAEISKYGQIKKPDQPTNLKEKQMVEIKLDLINE
jgi:hypothetical protein